LNDETESALKNLLALVLLMFSLTTVQSVFAHGDEDHSHAAGAVPGKQVAPRATAQTEDFELVAVMQGRTLVIYLDGFSSNEAVLDAQLEVESGSTFKAIAKQVSPGVYVVDLAKGVLEKAGKYPLTINVLAGDLGDVMTASLEIPNVEEPEHAHAESSWPAWMLVLAGMLLAIFGLVCVRLFIQRQGKPRGYGAGTGVLTQGDGK
jgi:hypothetical protein